MSEEAKPEDRREVRPEDEERGRYTEDDYGETGYVAPEDREPAGDDPDIAVRPPDE